MSEEFVTIATYGYVAEAQTAKLILEQEGIKTFLVDAEMVAMDWLLANAVGNIKLQVPAADAKMAAGILAKIQSKQIRREQHPDEDSTNRCLACGAELPEDASRCPSCGWSYL